MTRTLQILVCVVLVGVVRGPAEAEDSWTSSLGRYTRALAEQRRDEAQMNKEFPTQHVVFDLSLDEPYYVVNDYHRLPHVYLHGRRFFHRYGNHRIDYRGLSNLADETVFPWVPFEYGRQAYHHYPYGPYGHQWDGSGGDGAYGGGYHGYSDYTMGFRQVVPLEFRNTRGGGQVVRRYAGGRGTHTFWVGGAHRTGHQGGTHGHAARP